MPVVLKGQTKPSDFDISNHLMASTLNEWEKETVARNVIVISRKNGDAWFNFTFADYKAPKR